MTGDDFIKLGFWSQLLLLALVDWGTLLAFARGGVPWYHYVGFAAVNVILLGASWSMWGWLRQKRSRVIRFTPSTETPEAPPTPESDSP